MDARNGEKSSLNGAENQGPESPPSLIEKIDGLIAALDRQNSLIMELLSQNAVLIESLVDSAEPEDPAFDMSGNRIQVT